MAGVVQIDAVRATPAIRLFDGLERLEGMRQGVGPGDPGVDVRVEPQLLQRVHTLDLLRVVVQRLQWSLVSRIRRVLRRPR